VIAFGHDTPGAVEPHVLDVGIVAPLHLGGGQFFFRRHQPHALQQVFLPVGAHVGLLARLEPGGRRREEQTARHAEDQGKHE
jgi:hypothetical protein